MVEAGQSKNSNGNGNSGLGIALALIFMVVCFFAGRYYGAKSAAPAGPDPMMAMMAMAAPAVTVSEVKLSYIDNPREYVGYVEAIESVDLRPQVSGYLEKVNFTEGAMVTKGDILFSIDQRPYQATLELRKAQLAQGQAELAQAEKYLKRLQAADGRSVSQSDIDTAESDVMTKKAKIQEAMANIQLAEIDLEFTVIKAPISGYIGQAYITEGNYVSSMTEKLARVVQADPVRVVFSLSDKEYLRSIAKLTGSQLTIGLKLADGTVLEGTGVRDFEDNEIDQSTASIAIRVRFDNKDSKLVPGGYVTVVLDDAQRQQGIIIAQSAVLNSGNGSAVYVVDAENKAQIRPIVTGLENESGIVVESGLAEGDTIIIQGLQKVRPGSAVMPTK